MLSDDIAARLANFGYTVTNDDSWLIGFTISKVENDIKTQCNVLTIPDGLYQTEIDMIVGEFLFGKKNMGQLTSLDLSTVVKSIEEGDTTITFAIGSGSMTVEQRFDAIINYLRTPSISFAGFRRVKW